MLNYDFIEIGCSDFETLIQEDCDNKLGASIEPIKYYLDRLPEKNNIQKINWAISNFNGNITIFYINEENIKKHSLPFWVRGCNSVNFYHPTVLNLIKSRGITLDIFSKEIVQVHDIKYLFEFLNLKELEFLKIDCEGHDVVIVNNLLDYCENNITKLPKLLEFENNELSDKQKIQKLIIRLNKFGYKKSIDGHNLQFKLK